MKLKYDIPKYIAKIKMSSKKTILVEGKDDKDHMSNLLETLGSNNARIDSVEQITGTCRATSKNNRAKIEKIHSECHKIAECNNLYYLCDREFSMFSITDTIADEIVEHTLNNNMSLTSGHSMENYFFKQEILSNAYRYLCGNEFKTDAINIFSEIIDESFQLIAAITLSAKELGKCSYPTGVISWDNFLIEDEGISLDLSTSEHYQTEIMGDFLKKFTHYLEITKNSDSLVCSKLCRGHTGIILLQRIFAACLCKAILNKEDGNVAKKESENFSKIKESQLSSALAESWVRYVRDGGADYPIKLVEAVA